MAAPQPTFIWNLIERFIYLFEWFRPLVFNAYVFGLRIWIALIFWKSGVLKLGDWDTTLFLFEEEHPVPFIHYELAAYLGTATEIIAPALIVIGFGTRFGAAALLFMTAVIQFTYLSSMDHFYWAAACLFLMVHGAGLFSWDQIIRKKRMDDLPEESTGMTGFAIFAVWLVTFAVAYEYAASLGGIDAPTIVDSVRDAFKEK